MDNFSEDQKYELHRWHHFCAMCRKPECKICGPHFYPQRIDMWPVWAGIIKAPVQQLQDKHPMLDRFAPFMLTKRTRLYELTLTVDITKFTTPSLALPALLLSFERIIKSRMTSCVDWIRCIELHKNGYPHIHALLATSKAIQVTKITAMHPYRASMSQIKDLEKYLKYIYKDSTNLTVTAFCDVNQTPQIQAKAQIDQPPPPRQA